MLMVQPQTTYYGTVAYAHQSVLEIKDEHLAVDSISRL